MNETISYYRTMVKRFAYTLSATLEEDNPQQWLDEESRVKLEKFILTKQKEMGDCNFYYLAGGFTNSLVDETVKEGLFHSEAMRRAIDMFEKLLFSELE